jgi:glucosamine-phosphate N-acetyltransferase
MVFQIRRLDIQDYYKNYFNLLQELTFAENTTFNKWEKRINDINENKYHNIFVIEVNEKIIASVTLIIELKIIRHLGNVAHIEDVVVSKYYRNNGIAKKLIEHCINYSKKENCYKVILNCNENLMPFYEKFGFQNKNKEMSLYFV